jgi:TonB family protein
MYKGKSTCRELKRIRKMIAEQNNIPLEDSECHYEGDCAGTCPKCDAEVRFLENALRKSKQLGKVVTLSGAALAFSACGNQAPVETQSPYTVDSADVVMQIDSTDTDTLKIPPPPDEFDVLMGIVDIEEPYYDSIVQPPDDEEIYEGEGEVEVDVDVRTLPQFPGGDEAFMKYIEENLVYPEKAKEDSITGKVLVGFVVEADGSITNVEVIRSANKILDEEAVRVVKSMPKWIPGMQFDKPARTSYNLPITFKLD